MRFFKMNKAWVILVIAVSTTSSPTETLACGCGCNVFSVGNKWMMATSPGLKLSLQYSYMDQNKNWFSFASAPADSNNDKEIHTSFYTLGFQYMATREWGVMVEAPFWNRYFATLDENDSPASATHSSLGDIRVTGMYSGFSDDMSSTLLFGIKLPTGAIDQTLFDRDTQIGTGTTDILLGGYHMEQERLWGWFSQMLWLHALNAKDGYKPGDGVDVNIGFHYDGIVSSSSLIPILQVAGSFRGSDSGIESHPDETGYLRIFLVPGIELMLAPNIQIFADFKIPIMTEVTGYQLIAPSLLNASVNISL